MALERQGSGGRRPRSLSLYGHYMASLQDAVSLHNYLAAAKYKHLLPLLAKLWFWSSLEYRVFIFDITYSYRLCLAEHSVQAVVAEPASADAVTRG
jgi:hypothetical protein